MTKPIKISQVYLSAAIRRQRYLDFINEHPGVIAADIERHMLETYGEKAKTTNTTRTMCGFGELRSVPYKKQGYRYYATAKVTISAHEMATRALEKTKDRMNAEKLMAEVPNKQDSSATGYYRNCPDHPAHIAPKNQGGQGAVRSRVYVGSSAGMI
jgi:hypothetical protein